MYIAVKPLRWGKGTLLPGSGIPADDRESRNLVLLLRTGQISKIPAGFDVPIKFVPDVDLDPIEKRLDELPILVDVADIPFDAKKHSIKKLPGSSAMYAVFDLAGTQISKEISYEEAKNLKKASKA